MGKASACGWHSKPLAAKSRNHIFTTTNRAADRAGDGSGNGREGPDGTDRSLQAGNELAPRNTAHSGNRLSKDDGPLIPSRADTMEETAGRQ